MYSIILDPSSPYQVKLPTTNKVTKLIAIAENFVAYDETLPLEEQSPLLPDIRQLLEQCVPTQNSFKSSEAQRTIASEAVKRLDGQIKTIIRKIHHKINFEYMETPESAEAWGFQVKQGTRRILLPKKRSERLTFLNTYIAQEESRPPEERFTTPDLAVIINLRDDLKANLATRRRSRGRRKDSYSARSEALKALYDTLRMAGGLIILKKFNRSLTPGLEKWGIEVIKRQTKEKEAEAPPTTNGTKTSTTNDVQTKTNGTETITNGRDRSIEATISADTTTNGHVDFDSVVDSVVGDSD